jgi:hypothetical protein
MSTLPAAPPGRLAAILLRLPDWIKVLAALVAITGAAFGAGLRVPLLWADYRALPLRVDDLQAWRAAVDSADLAGQVAAVRDHQARQDTADAEERLVLRYLACRARESDNGRDPRGCEDRFRDPLDELLPVIAPTRGGSTP